MPTNLERREKELKARVDELHARHKETASPEDLQAMAEAHRELIALQKERMVDFQRARESLTRLERAIGNLPDEIFYQKSVLIFEEEKYGQAEGLFRELLDRPNVDTWLQERARARLAATLQKLKDDPDKQQEFWELRDWVLENAEDSEALVIIRNCEREMEVEHRAEFEFGEMAEENAHYVYRHFDQHEHHIRSAAEELNIREALRIEHFDLYLDQINDSYYVRGEKIDRPNMNDIRFLFTKILRPNSEVKDLICAMFDDVVPGTAITGTLRARFDQTMRRLRTWLETRGIEIRGRRLPADLKYCLLYDKRWYEELFGE